jgi:hypothetical protein
MQVCRGALKRMAKWRFYQGLRTEWRWYHVDNRGGVIAESDRGFAELQGCMANAEAAGFKGEAFQVYARQAGSFNAGQPATEDDTGNLPTLSESAASDGQSPR